MSLTWVDASAVSGISISGKLGNDSRSESICVANVLFAIYSNNWNKHVCNIYLVADTKDIIVISLRPSGSYNTIYPITSK